MSENLTADELRIIGELKNKTVLLNTEAEKSVALAKLAESEAKNYILQIYNKYDLKIGKDQIIDTGEIKREEKTSSPEVTVSDDDAVSEG